MWLRHKDIKDFKDIEMLRRETKNLRILGLDPGFARTGFAVLEKMGSRLQVLTYGCWETKKSQAFADRLVFLARELKKLIKKFKPECAVIEELFFFKNLKTAIGVAEARGALLLTLGESGLKILELTPLQVKQSLCGYGRAEKSQIQKMVQLILELQEKPRPDDAADALAVAVAGSSYRRF